MNLLDLMTDAQLLADASANAEGALIDAEPLDPSEAEGAHAVYLTLDQASRALTAAKKALATKIGEAIGPEKQVLNGQPVKRHADMSRCSAWSSTPAWWTRTRAR